MDVLKDNLKLFYSEPKNVEALVNCIIKETVSRRLLEYLVMWYSGPQNVKYVVEGPGGGMREFRMYDEYKIALDVWGKDWFDPFARKPKKATKAGIMEIAHEGKTITLMIGQLNFFRWTIKNRILEYAIEHRPEIEREKREHDRILPGCEKTPGGKRRRPRVYRNRISPVKKIG